MCVGVPVQVTRADGHVGYGVSRHGAESVDLSLVGARAAGDWVLSYLGTAVRVLDAEEARQINDALHAVALAQRGEAFEHLFADLIEATPSLPDHLRPSAGEPIADSPHQTAGR